MEESRKEREKLQDQKRELVIQKENAQNNYEQLMKDKAKAEKELEDAKKLAAKKKEHANKLDKETKAFVKKMDEKTKKS